MGNKLQSRSKGNVVGIDVSHHNGDVEWKQVAATGVKFVYLKLTEGKSYVDKTTYDNYIAAKNAGLRVGFYHYAHCTNDPIAEVDFFLKKLGDMKADLPHCLDLEENKGLSKTKVSTFAVKWMEYLQKKTGITPILYTGYSFIKSNFTSALAKYPLWVARYSASNRAKGFDNPGDATVWKSWAMFQYTDSGKVKGISGNVDINEMDLAFFKSIDSGVVVVGDANPPSSYRKGDSGLGVKELQQKLVKAGLNLPVHGDDGSYGDETVEAVKAFQKQYGLAIDGIAGEKTLDKLTEVLTNPPATEEKPKEEPKPAVKPKPTPTKPVSKADSGIKSIQVTLNSRYHVGLATDGLYGPSTKTALIKGLQTELNKQYKAKLAVDGIFGKGTAKACVTLSEGARGNITWILQAALYSVGYDPKGVDGAFGKGTTKAVTAFQKDNGLSTDGIAGKNTFNKLF
ncbi:peptidoglycan-binding protein [Priestia aryabhattai]|uniref:GH25 family lysozyme n=1 Tax=Priestia aryabhattai TaxID=412384 RepID=UPI001C0C2C45|nr:GH25 family lysozyme [Priestia aryabhattai]MBU3569291.1 peptidoglycan-binding protein [Priestia aryabhattai]